jgi:hypothetical protein
MKSNQVRSRESGTVDLTGDWNQLMTTSETARWLVEVTDTFGGQANYGWVSRYYLPVKQGESNTALIRRAKKIAGYSNVRGITVDTGTHLEYRPDKMAVIMFVIWEDL